MFFSTLVIRLGALGAELEALIRGIGKEVSIECLLHAATFTGAVFFRLQRQIF